MPEVKANKRKAVLVDLQHGSVRPCMKMDLQLIQFIQTEDAPRAVFGKLPEGCF